VLVGYGLRGEDPMKQSPQPRRDPEHQRWIVVGVLWVVALLVAATLADDAIEDASDAFGERLYESAWAWPLAGAIALSVVTSSIIRRRWPHSYHQFLLALIIAGALYGLTAAIGPLAVVLVLGFVAIVGLLGASVLVLPRQLAPPLPAETLEGLGDRDRVELADARLKLQNDLRTTALQAIAGLAVLAGAVLAFQQLTADRQQATATQRLTLQGQASERFTRAVDQLASDRPEARLGGIYGLEQIAQQAPDNRLAVAEVLVAYLRDNSEAPPKSSTPRLEPTSQPVKPLRIRAAHVQAALTVLVHRTRLDADPQLNLRDLDLSGADISEQAFPESSRMGAKPAELRGADLRGTDLRGATFRGVYLWWADLRGADLRGANLRRVEPTDP
jgi:Pentapeptide repeats (8 copies)